MGGYREKVETELHKICGEILDLIDKNLLPAATNGESKVFYYKMKGDYYRYIAEFSEGDKKSQAAESAKGAYQEATTVATSDLLVTHPIRLISVELLRVPLRSLEQPGGGVQDGTNCIRRRHCGVGQRQRGHVQ